MPTPGAATIEQVTKFLKCPAQQMIKTLIYVADGKPIAVLLRGDHEANEGKVRRAAGAAKVELADPAVIEQVTGAPVGFAGPVGLKQPIPIYADREIEKIVNGITGANQAETHLTGVNYGRDFQVAGFADLRNAVDGDPCPRCSSKLAVRHAIEVGHVFKLGTKYSDALSARFLDQSEQLKSIIMGCYGIGVNRIIAALIETCHDANGIIWPMTLAPYEVLLSPVKVTDPATKEATERLYDELTAAGIEVLAGRSRRSRRREVQGRRPDRHSAPRGDRRARPEGRQAGDEVAVGQAGRDDRPGRRRPDDRRLGDRRAEREQAVPRAVTVGCGRACESHLSDYGGTASSAHLSNCYEPPTGIDCAGLAASLVIAVGYSDLRFSGLLDFGRLATRLACFEDRQITVIDFQGQGREAGRHDAAAVSAPGVLCRVPTTVGTADRRCGPACGPAISRILRFQVSHSSRSCCA